MNDNKAKVSFVRIFMLYYLGYQRTKNE